MDHSKEFLKLVEEAKADVREVSVAETLERVENGAILIAVREDNEYASAPWVARCVNSYFAWRVRFEIRVFDADA